MTILFESYLMRAALFMPMAWLLSLPMSALAEEQWNAEVLMHEFSRVEEATLEFTEVKKSIFLVIDTELKGTITYRAPDFLEKIIETPYYERLLLDGDTMLLEKTSSIGQNEPHLIKQVYSVNSNEILKSVVEGFQFMMSGNYDELSMKYSFDFSGKREDWQLTLTPKTEEILRLIEKIDLSGQDTRIQKIVTFQPDGDKSTLYLSHLPPAGS